MTPAPAFVAGRLCAPARHPEIAAIEAAVAATIADMDRAIAAAEALLSLCRHCGWDGSSRRYHDNGDPAHMVESDLCSLCLERRQETT